MPGALHSLLEAQLRETCGRERVPEALLEAVSEAYRRFEDAVEDARRNAEVVAHGLSQANDQLRLGNRLLESEVAARTQVEETLEAKAAELERSNAALEMFAYVASHDLQEPLRMVSSYCQLLARRYKDKLDKEGAEFIGFAVDGATRMQRLIRSLLDYSRVGRGDRPFEFVRCADVCDAAMRNLQVALEESGARVTRDDLPTLKGDAESLVRLFQNLVANGIKFRRDEAPAVHVGAARDGDAWRFSVRDNGIGIDPAEAGKLFTPFARLAAADKFRGTGLGLATCRKIVEHHGGKIWVESVPGRGTTFLFTIPDGKGEA